MKTKRVVYSISVCADIPADAINTDWGKMIEIRPGKNVGIVAMAGELADVELTDDEID